MEKFDYIVNFWFGPRSSVKEFKYERGKGAIQATDNYGFWYHKLHHYFLVHAHCKFLSRNKIPNLNKVQFVINVGGGTPSNKLLADVREIIEWYKLDINVILHDNTNHSYGAWNAGLKNLILHNTKAKYCFLCEDDYVPTDKDFYIPFFNKFNSVGNDGKFGYVCQMADELKLHVIIPKKENREKIESKLQYSSSREVKMRARNGNNEDPDIIHMEYISEHAAISNGFISMDVARELNKTGDIFTFEMVKDPKNKNSEARVKLDDAVHDLSIRAQEQVVFTNKLLMNGYLLGDISEDCYTPFDQNNNNKVKKYGNEFGYCPIKPYKYPEIIPLDKMSRNDLQWFLGIRNDDSTRYYLENDSTFTLDEAREWFDNLDKDKLYPYLIISEVTRFWDASISRYGGIKDQAKQRGIWKEEKTKIGYVRQYMTEVDGEEMVEIGIDISPEYRRRGLAKAAYVTLLRDLDKASLWVFEDNFARNLYFDLGFRDTGETQINRGRKEYRMVWKRKI